MSGEEYKDKGVYLLLPMNTFFFCFDAGGFSEKDVFRLPLNVLVCFELTNFQGPSNLASKTSYIFISQYVKNCVCSAVAMCRCTGMRCKGIRKRYLGSGDGQTQG